MLRYTLIRLGGMIGVLLAISILTFLIMHAIPGGPFDPLKMPGQRNHPEEPGRQVWLR